MQEDHAPNIENHVVSPHIVPSTMLPPVRSSNQEVIAILQTIRNELITEVHQLKIEVQILNKKMGGNENVEDK